LEKWDQGFRFDGCANIEWSAVDGVRWPNVDDPNGPGCPKMSQKMSHRIKGPWEWRAQGAAFGRTRKGSRPLGPANANRESVTADVKGTRWTPNP